MPVSFEKAPVGDSVAKVNNEIAVGSDLAFQRRWWRVERIVWVFFLCIVICDALGVFGRGPMAKATLDASNGAFQVKYEWVERFRTPSIMSILFSDKAIHNGQVQLWLSQKFVDPLGNQRIIPQPVSSRPVSGGILYTFDMGSQHLGQENQQPTVQFALEPGTTGIYKLQIGSPGVNPVEARIIVLP